MQFRPLFLGSVAPAISGLPADIMQSRKQVFEFTFVCFLGGIDCFAHHVMQTIQLVAGEFDEVAFHRRGPLQIMVLGETTSTTLAAPHSNLIAAGRGAPWPLLKRRVEAYSTRSEEGRAPPACGVRLAVTGNVQ